MATKAWRPTCLAAAGCAALGLMTSCYTPPRNTPAARASTTQRAAYIPTTTTATKSGIAPSAPSPTDVATQHLAAIAQQHRVQAISVAALNTGTGAAYRWGARGGMWTGSVYKLFVLEALLLERQRSGGWLDSSELADSTIMIEQSDNGAGYRLFLDVGGSRGLAAAAHRLGLRHTRLGLADPSLTSMDASDGITLLRNLVSGGPLTMRSKRYILSLMHDIEADQRWGVGVVADRGTTFANKNGWMQVDNDNGPDEDDEGRWLVNSIGIVQVHGQQLLMAIFTRHDPDYESGVGLVQRLARVVAPAVAVP